MGVPSNHPKLNRFSIETPGFGGSPILRDPLNVGVQGGMTPTPAESNFGMQPLCNRGRQPNICFFNKKLKNRSCARENASNLEHHAYLKTFVDAQEGNELEQKTTQKFLVYNFVIVRRLFWGFKTFRTTNATERYLKTFLLKCSIMMFMDIPFAHHLHGQNPL